VTQWFIVHDGKERGPFTAQQLKEMAAKSQLAPDDLIRRADMQVPRKASSIKGLFATGAPTFTKQTSPSSPDAPPAAQKKGVLSKKPLIIASVVGGACLFLCCGGFGIIAMFGGKMTDVARKQLAEADGLWDRGDRAGAAGKYRAILEGHRDTFLKVEERPRVYGRVIDYEYENGNAEAGKKLIEKAAKDNITPTVNHPEAKAVLSATQVATKGGEPPPAEVDGTLTARFLPCVPGDVKRYEEETYDDRGRAIMFTESKETYGDGTIKVETTMKNPGLPPAQSTREDKIRIQGGFVERGRGSGNEMNWTKIIKLGVKPGGNGWPDGQNTGAFHFVRFEKATAHGPKGLYEVLHAVLEHRYFGMDKEGQSVTIVREIVMERDSGIQGEKSWITVGGKKRLASYKRLISSTNR
jgi:hypothetical protein